MAFFLHFYCGGVIWIYYLIVWLEGGFWEWNCTKDGISVLEMEGFYKE